MPQRAMRGRWKGQVAAKMPKTAHTWRWHWSQTRLGRMLAVQVAANSPKTAHTWRRQVSVMSSRRFCDGDLTGKAKMPPTVYGNPYGKPRFPEPMRVVVAFGTRNGLSPYQNVRTGVCRRKSALPRTRTIHQSPDLCLPQHTSFPRRQGEHSVNLVLRDVEKPSYLAV